MNDGMPAATLWKRQNLCTACTNSSNAIHQSIDRTRHDVLDVAPAKA